MFGITGILTLLLAANALGSAIPKSVFVNTWDARIINGENAKQGEFPGQLSMQSGDFHFCGASIINEYWAITAAHCVSGSSPSSMRLYAGSVNLKSPGSTGSYHQVEAIIMHNEYSSRDSWVNDIAVLRVKTPFNIDGVNVKGVTLPKQGASPAEGSTATVVGWGRLTEGGASPTDLQKVDIFIASQKECNAVYNGEGLNVYSTQICAEVPEGNKGSCHGDSGGPLFVDGVISGLVSWARGCANRGYPTVYTRVSSYVDWIHQQIDLPDRVANLPVRAGPWNPRIINGEDAKQGEFPSQLSMNVYRGHYCGASVVNEYWALTAAHCVEGLTAEQVKFYAGSVDLEAGGSYHQVLAIVIHRDYDESDSWVNDIALLRVKDPFVIDGVNVKAVTLPVQDVSPAEGSKATVIGWGNLYQGGGWPTILQKVDIAIATKVACQNAYSGYGMTIYSTQICADVPEGNKGSCNGDSGGPLFVDGVISGLVSWAAGCAVQGYPTVFTRVASYVDWIHQIIDLPDNFSQHRM